MVRTEWLERSARLETSIAHFARDIETFKERKLRLALESSRAAIAAARLHPPPPLEERLYYRPRRKGRACGSRHRVMI